MLFRSTVLISLPRLRPGYPAQRTLWGAHPGTRNNICLNSEAKFAWRCFFLLKSPLDSLHTLTLRLPSLPCFDSMRFSDLFVPLSVLVLGAVGFDNARYDNVSVVFYSARTQCHPYHCGWWRWPLHSSPSIFNANQLTPSQTLHFDDRLHPIDGNPDGSFFHVRACFGFFTFSRSQCEFTPSCAPDSLSPPSAPRD